jgi:hypothetical protein
MPHDETNWWVAAAAFATVTASAAFAAVWVGRETPTSLVPPRWRVKQRAKVSGRAKANQVSGNQYIGGSGSMADSATPDDVDQRFKASGDARLNQVGGDQHIPGQASSDQ